MVSVSQPLQRFLIGSVSRTILRTRIKPIWICGPQSFARDASLRNLGTVQEFNWKDKEVGSGDNYETCYLLDGNDVIISDTYDEDNDNSNT
jgi:hypothetical protein